MSKLIWLLSWRFLQAWLPPAWPFVTGYVAAGTGIALASVMIALVLARLHVASISVFYLVVILPTAIRFGLGPGCLWPLVTL